MSDCVVVAIVLMQKILYLVAMFILPILVILSWMAADYFPPT
jgi:hypothetical protein